MTPDGRDPHDALDALRGFDPRVRVPDAAGIRRRATRLRARRQTALATVSGVVVLVVAVGVVALRPGPAPSLLTTGPREGRQAPSAAEESPVLKQDGPTAGAAVRSDSTADSVSPVPEVASGAAAQSQPAGTNGAQAASGVKVDSGLVVRLEVSRTPVVPGRPADLTLIACNESPHEVRIQFGTAQRYDFEVARDGELVWRWSDGMVFAQVAGEEAWEPEECRQWTEEWPGTTGNGAPAPPGSYEAVGILASGMPQHTDPQRVCVAAC